MIQGHRPNRDGLGLADEGLGALVEIWLVLLLIMNHMITHNVYYVKLDAMLEIFMMSPAVGVENCDPH